MNALIWPSIFCILEEDLDGTYPRKLFCLFKVETKVKSKMKSKVESEVESKIESEVESKVESKVESEIFVEIPIVFARPSNFFFLTGALGVGAPS